MSNWMQGKYTVLNESKYIGHTAPTFRSSLEARFFHFCDMTDSILRWGSEIIEIPYTISGQTRVHKYIVDVFVEARTTGGNTQRFLVEIKPKSQTVPPTRPKTNNWKALRSYRYALVMWQKNVSKWRAANIYCQTRGMKFMLVTEDDIPTFG